ncbi:ER membrane protein complex subunit 2 like protein [Argiope bruennichi]|uniref:ER membrane protein complex subunit 2 n=1 Tax=Argiope bruennichi TaxID=94029 RepID=A0A8T0F7R2_ARGBR|nr:ER membrane protein complex subunit 2 like protein [Argiope bruennichi]
MDWQEARETLRQWREDNMRCSEEVIEIWQDVLSNYTHKVGDEKWLIYEQVCLAALDCHRLDIAQECLETLDKQFPGSFRVRKLRAMEFEALDRYDDALKLYESILQHDESNSVIYKRKVAVLKAQNKISEAVKELTDYLKKFMSDHEAWMELSDLYLMEQDYYKAAFCYEELILYNPHNHLYHQRYAEIQYTIGGLENMELARAYFAQSIKLNPRNMRSLYGFFLAATNVAASPKCSALKKKENLKYASWAALKIGQKYQDQICDDTHVKSVQGMLGLLTLNSST